MYSIRVKITAITILAILTSVLSVLIVAKSTIQRENDRSSTETMGLITQSTQRSVEQYLESVAHSVETAANIAYDALDSVVLVDNCAAGAMRSEQTDEQAARVDAYMAEYCARVQSDFASIAGHTQGVITYYYCINPDISETEHGFFYSRVGKTGFVEQEPLDARELDPEDIAHTTWYYTPIRRGRPSWVGPYTAHFLGEMLTCSYLVPIYRAGALIGVMGMDISFSSLEEQVRDIRVYDSGFAALFDIDGRALSYPGHEYGSMPEVAELAPGGIIHRESSIGEMIRYTINGEQRQLCFTTLSNGMKLVVCAPVREITAPWTRLMRIHLLDIAVILAVFSVLLMLVMGLITRPLKRLTAASRRLAEGDYDVALDYRSRDEVGALTNAFTQMRNRIRLYIDDLNRQVNTDMLTGLPNMRRFFELAEAERDRLVYAGRKPVLLYFDLVGMKHYNRQFGFEEGDRLICDIGHILAGYCGEQNICRFSEDHFAAVSEEAGLEGTLEAILRDCRGANGGKSLPIRVGVYPNSLERVRVSVACDRAKYACDQHRGSFVSGCYFFAPSMLGEIDTSRYVLGHLDQALAEGWVRVCYQPIIRAVSGEVCDEEALSRWVDPIRGTLSPGEYIPILENARLIWKLDLYVLDRVLEKMRAQRDGGLRLVPNSVNLSRSDFDACDIVEEFRRRVDAADIPREMLIVEVTESMVGSDFEFMKREILRFRELGFQVWMDDFGSGYSALDVLQDIRFDLLKFDMRFMQRFNEGDESRIILTELLRMAAGLGVDTICEGVETKEQAKFLREIGCTKLQGFFYGKAIPFEEIVKHHRLGDAVRFENPEEAPYLAAVGRVDVFNPLLTADGAEAEGLRGVFSVLPVGILELRDREVSCLRSNQAYRDFVRRFFGTDLDRERPEIIRDEGVGDDFIAMLRKCVEGQGSAYFDGKIPGGVTIHSFIKYVGTNPVSCRSSVAVTILSIGEGEKQT